VRLGGRDKAFALAAALILVQGGVDWLVSRDLSMATEGEETLLKTDEMLLARTDCLKGQNRELEKAVMFLASGIPPVGPAADTRACLVADELLRKMQTK
jgi:hypothetical protein